MEEVIRMMPHEMEEASFALGSTRLETAMRVVTAKCYRDCHSGTSCLRPGDCDAASVYLQQGSPIEFHLTSEPCCVLALAVFFQLGTPFLKFKREPMPQLSFVDHCPPDQFWLAMASHRLSKYVIK